MDTIRKADSRRGRIAYEVAGLAWLAEASDPGAAVVSRCRSRRDVARGAAPGVRLANPSRG